MSTTTKSPSTGAVRRTMPSGSVNSGVSLGGVRQPSTHVVEGAPRVAGADSGTAGWVGEGTTLADGMKDSLDVGEPPDGAEAKGPSASPPPRPSSQAAEATATRVSTTTNLRIASGDPVGRSACSCTADSIGTRCDEPVCTVRPG